MTVHPTQAMEEVSFVSGKTRLFGIIGHPIEQVRSPEMVTAELHGRGIDAILLPIHVRPDDFDTVLPSLLRVANLDGLIFTIPYKAAALSLCDVLGPQASVVGAINALGRQADGGWKGEIFDGLGCVEGFRRRGIGFAGKRVMLIGTGGAGSAIGVAVAFEGPAAMRIFDMDEARAADLARKIATVDKSISVEIGPPRVDDVDILINASPVGMLGDERKPIAADTLPASLTVFDAIVKPETTPLLALAERCGCTIVRGREMMRGQIASIVNFFGHARS